MLNIEDLNRQFDEKADSIKHYATERSETSKEYQKALDLLKHETADANQKLPLYSGARILEEGVLKPFFQKWTGPADAQDWMDKTLTNTTVGSVDGSQIYPDKNYNLPIAVIQTASIYNKHTKATDFKQRTKSLILSPEEFEEAHIYAYSSEFVDAHRFKAESREIEQLLRDHEDILVLMDGSLILSHANSLNKNIRHIYIKAMKKLLGASKDTQNPVIAYTDNTYPGDLTRMLQHLYALKKSKLQDTALLRPMLKNWGDRTSAFLCDRDDRRTTGNTRTPSTLDRYGEHKHTIAFFYINLGERIGRAEYPLWAHKEGLTETIADILRAESIIRGGYPDLLLQAHKAALIQTREHNIFYALLENFCNTHNITLFKSRKQLHKKII